MKSVIRSFFRGSITALVAIGFLLIGQQAFAALGFIL